MKAVTSKDGTGFAFEAADIAVPTRAGRREWIGLAAIALPCLVVVMDITVLHLAVPTLTTDLKPSPSQLLWIVDIYGFLLAGSLMTMGTLGDRIGRRRLLMIGAAAFATASVLAALSTTAVMLIAARAILGVAGATLAPSTLSLIRSMFHDPRQRTQAIAIWGASFAAGSALGPPIGGLLIQHFWWGAVFLVPVPVMATLLLVGPKLLPEFRDPAAGRLDIASAALSLGAVLATIFGLKLLAQDGLSWAPVVSGASGFVLGALFVRRQRRLAYPLVDFRLFRVPAFSATLAIFMLNAFVMFAASFFTAQYFQLVVGLSPLQAGLWTLPAAISVITGSMLAPTLVRWAPRTVVMVAGLLVCALGFAVLALVGIGGLPVLVAGSVVTGLGAGPLVALVPDAIVGAAPHERAGSAASISSTSAEFGGALGIAVLGSIGAFVYRLVIAGAVPSGVPTQAAQVAIGTLGGAVAVSRDLPPHVGAALVHAARGAFSQGFVTVAVISAALMIMAATMMAAVAGRWRMSNPSRSGRSPAR